MVFANIIGLPGHRNKRKNVLELTIHERDKCSDTEQLTENSSGDSVESDVNFPDLRL